MLLPLTRLWRRRLQVTIKDAELQEEDVLGGSNPMATNPMAVLRDLEDVGDFKRRLSELGARIAVRNEEGRSTAGLIGHFIFTGRSCGRRCRTPGSPNTSAACGRRCPPLLRICLLCTCLVRRPPSRCRLLRLRKQRFSSHGSRLTRSALAGSPGTGKTTVARKMGQILHAYGVLATDQVIVTSGQDLTGQYVGQTKKSVEEKMQAARGGVLFVDEVRTCCGWY